MSRTGKTMPSKAEVAEFWYEYGRRVIKAGKYHRLPFFVIRLTDSLIEPTCWGCQQAIAEHDEDFDKTRGANGFRAHEAYKIYNRISRLYRCHIIPSSLGGSDKPNNIVLMCADCHREAPDTVNPRHFFTWLKNRPQAFIDQEASIIKSAYTSLGVTPDHLNKCILEIRRRKDEKAFLEYAISHSSSHFDRRNGSCTKYTSYFANLLDWCRSSYGVRPTELRKLQLYLPEGW